MTRFARAKGSKASNERREEEATPWHVMRQQLADQLSGNESQQNIDVSYNLKEIVDNDLDSKKEVWSDFGETNTNTKKGLSKVSKQKKKDKRTGKFHNEGKQEHNTKQNKLGDINDKSIHNVFEKKDILIETNTTELISIENNKDKERKNKTVNIKKQPVHQPVVVDTDSKKRKLSKISNNLKNKKHKPVNDESIEKQKFANKMGSCSSTTDEPKQRCDSKKLKNCNNTPLNKSITEKSEFMSNNKYSRNKLTLNPKWKKYDDLHTITANGREIKVVRYDGFFVKKDDAAELKKLRKKLKTQNIEKEKIKTIMKLERRKAEKALAREKNNVCFHCRKFGHNFNDCPDIKDTEMSKSGMCFKCGSMEHTHFQCKVLQGQDFRYAVCFVCKEQGHIARQCSLNPQGQYPKGGKCHLCGEVTHLRKDCPTATNEQPSSNSLTVEKLRNDQLEDISVGSSHNKEKNTKKKIINF